jgi:hypothetical protein
MIVNGGGWPRRLLGTAAQIDGLQAKPSFFLLFRPAIALADAITNGTVVVFIGFTYSVARIDSNLESTIWLKATVRNIKLEISGFTGPDSWHS